MTRRCRYACFGAAMLVGLVTVHAQGPPVSESPQSDPFRFKSGVELVNVTATVSDRSGRFVSGLTADDFTVYEDGVQQTITHFSAERVPVSLGIVLDTSGSMAGEKIEAARSALSRLVFDLLDRDDEIFLYRFNDAAVLVEGWTSDRTVLSRALGRTTPAGGTAMYDAVAEAIPLAAQGQRQKKALVVISDGNDTSSRLTVREIKQRIRASEVLVYAIGIDGDPMEALRRPLPRTRPPRRRPPPVPLPFPGIPRPPGAGGRFPLRQQPPIFDPRGSWPRNQASDERVNVAALREMTDDSGGRTEIVRDAQDLNPATASIADELSKQYDLGYVASSQKDGRWHAIKVELRNPDYHVRARTGYVAN